MRVVFALLHGIGGEIVSRMMKETGFSDFHIVEDQFRPDGDFPTLDTTLNPEDREVYEHALTLEKSKDADLIIATDPDCDRMGVMVQKTKSRYVLLTGNEAGALMLNYLLSTKRQEELANGFIAETIVTTRLADSIARRFGIGIEEVLTGFKYIGELIRRLQDTGDKKFIFDMEDSCGYLMGTDVRDKDGVIGCMLIAETAAWYKSKGMSLYQGLRQLHRKYGWFYGELVTCNLSRDHALDSQALFSDMEGDAFKCLGVTAVRNYTMQLRHDLGNGEISKLGLPKSQVVFYELPDGWFCLRPSGTESKIKIYIEVHGKSFRAASKRLNKIKKYVMQETGVNR